MDQNTLEKLTGEQVMNQSKTLDQAWNVRMRVDSLTKIGDWPNLDSFWRFRVSNPYTLFDSKNIFNDTDIADTEENLPLFYDN